MSDSTQLTVQPKERASNQLAAFLGMDQGMMLDTLKAQCFKGKHPDEISDTQLAAFVSVANIVKLNPLLPGMLYAYPEKNGGITPIVGPDGTMKKLQELIDAGTLLGYECTVFPDDPALPPTHATCVIDRAGDGKKPAKVTCYFKEWVVASNPNWNTRPRHMLWIRTIKQTSRQVIHGLPMDDDEYKIAQMANVTGTGDDAAEQSPQQERPKVERSKKGAAKALENPVQPLDPPIDIPVVPLKVEEKMVTPAPAAAAPVAPAPVAPKPAPPTAEDPEPMPIVQRRTSLMDKETATFKGLEIVEFKADMFGKTPAIRAEFKGNFTGVAYDQAVSLKDPTDVTKGFNYGSGWQLSKPVNVTMTGKARKDLTVAAMITAIEIAQPVNAEIP